MKCENVRRAPLEPFITVSYHVRDRTNYHEGHDEWTGDAGGSARARHRVLGGTSGRGLGGNLSHVTIAGVLVMPRCVAPTVTRVGGSEGSLGLASRG